MPGADPFSGDHPRHLTADQRDAAGDALRGGIHQRVHSPLAEPHADVDHNSGHDQRGLALARRAQGRLPGLTALDERTQERNANVEAIKKAGLIMTDLSSQIRILQARVTEAERERDDAQAITIDYQHEIETLVARVTQLEKQTDHTVCDRTVEKLTERARGLEAVVDRYGVHERDCILSQYQQGRPTPSGGYEMMYQNTWYEVRPTNKTPACQCGLDTLRSHD